MDAVARPQTKTANRCITILYASYVIDFLGPIQP